MICYCEARTNGKVKGLKVNANSFSAARSEFLRSTPGVKDHQVSVVVFQNETSYAKAWKGERPV